MKLFHKILRAFGLVTLGEHTATLAHKQAQLDEAIGDKFAELAADIPKLSKEEHELIETLRERREVRSRDWSDAERAEVARVLKTGPGELIRHELHAWAHERLKLAVKALPGSEPRALGFAHGASMAAEVMDSLSEFTAPESGEQDSTDARA